MEPRTDPTLDTADESTGDPALVDTNDPGAGAPDVLGRGALIGRYLVLGHLGSGGMGVVYAAHDPELDRKIALKLLKPGHGRPDARAQIGRAHV